MSKTYLNVPESTWQKHGPVAEYAPLDHVDNGGLYGSDGVILRENRIRWHNSRGMADPSVVFDQDLRSVAVVPDPSSVALGCWAATAWLLAMGWLRPGIP